jgi:hypothetical protein
MYIFFKDDDELEELRDNLVRMKEDGIDLTENEKIIIRKIEEHLKLEKEQEIKSVDKLELFRITVGYKIVKIVSEVFNVDFVTVDSNEIFRNKLLHEVIVTAQDKIILMEVFGLKF